MAVRSSRFIPSILASTRRISATSSPFTEFISVRKDPTSVPLYGLAYTLFYNTKLFKQAGISAPPKTWSEFVADAKKLTKPPDQYGVTLEGGSISEGANADSIWS